MSTQQGETVVTDEIRSVVGEVMPFAKSFPISVSDIPKWATAICYQAIPPRLFSDEEYGASTIWGEIIAPEEFNPFAWMAKDPLPFPSSQRQIATLQAGLAQRQSEAQEAVPS